MSKELSSFIFIRTTEYKLGELIQAADAANIEYALESTHLSNLFRFRIPSNHIASLWKSHAILKQQNAFEPVLE